MDDDVRTRRWQRISSVDLDADPLQALRKAIAAVRAAPGDLAARQRLRALAAEQAAWEQLALLLGDEVRAVQRPDVAAAFYEELADIHENLEQPLETIAAMEALVAIQPGDIDQLDRLAWLYRRAGAWAKAAEAFERLAGLASGGRAHAAARAAATLYREHGRIEPAIAMYRAIVTRRPNDAEAWRALDELLERLGRWQELVDVRGALAELAPDPVERAVRLRAQARAAEQAGDAAAAAELIARAARDAPADLSGLVDYAEVLAREGKVNEAAEVLATRLAEALHDGAPADRVTALRLRLADMRQECGDQAGALALLEEQLAEAPQLAAARERLLQIARRQRDAGELRAAERTYERLGELAGAELVAHELAEVHAARTLERALDRATELAPAQAAELLRQTLADAPDDAPPAQLARVVHHYARAVAAAGDRDHAHQLLQEAHHLARRDLEITLALGESCFQRKLWREAAIHLGSLADHPDAARHAPAVASGLVRAAQAEARALRPANAVRHYEAAVRVDPRCAPAWHALAELAAERGDVALAEQAWARAAEAGDDTVLKKLLAVQRKRGAPERGITCERLAELESDPRVKKELAEEAVQAYEAAGELARGRAMARRLIADHPLDTDAIACASSIALAAADYEAAASWLGRALGAWDTAGDRGEGDPRRAELWRRLGDAERARGEGRAALAAYQRAVATAADSDGALAARRGLVELAGAAGRPAGESLAALVEAEQRPPDVLAWARELARAGQGDDARAMFELARALGARLTGDDERALATSPAPAMASDEAYAAPLPEAERRALVDDPDDTPIGELLELLGEAAALVCPDPKSALERAGLGDARRLAAASEAALVAMHPQVANALGGTPTLLFGSPRAPAALVPVLAWPPVIVAGGRLADLRARSRGDAGPEHDVALRFAVGRAVELARPRRLFAAAGEPGAFARRVAALLHAAGRPAGDADPALASEAERLRAQLSVPLRRKLAERVAALAGPGEPSAPPFGGAARREVPALDPAAYVAACQRAADRSGLLACGDVAAAIELAGGPSVARHLVRLAASPGYLAARRRLTSRARSQPLRR